jgi:hypothetical protein
MPMISEDKIWFSPIRAFSAYMKAVENYGYDAVHQDDKYKRIVETRVVAILCFAMFEATKTPWYLQICKSDPPDALIMRQSPTVKGDDEVMGIEVTAYIRNKTGLPKDTLLDQLKKTKMFEYYHMYTDHDAILVDLGTDFQPDYNEIAEYMKEINAPYQVWVIQQVSTTPDTIAEMTICNVDGACQTQINIGAAWHNMKEQNILGAFRKIRVGSVDKVRVEKKGEPINGAPWETMLL